MVSLNTNDYRKLITILQNLSILSNERERRLILELAGLKSILSLLDISGSPFVSTSEIVSFLSKYGRLDKDYESLGVFLNTIKEYIGAEQKQFIDTLLIRYKMMIPISDTPQVKAWKGSETDEERLEKIIGANTLRPIAFLSQGLQAAKSVAFINVNGGVERWSGTGFLISNNFLITNYHVIPNISLLEKSIFRFNYEDNFKGESQNTFEYYAKANGIYYSNEKLDYALVQLEENIGKDWGKLPLSKKISKEGERVNIIQHPAGQPKQISLQNNFVQYADKTVIQYVTSTLPGSSGSPVLNDDWEVVAIHHAGGNIQEPTTNRSHFRNEGILISAILEDLPIKIKQIIDF